MSYYHQPAKKMTKKDKGFVGICPVHNQDYRKCDECMPKQPKNSWEEEFDRKWQVEMMEYYNSQGVWNNKWIKDFIRHAIESALKKQRKEWLDKFPKEKKITNPFKEKVNENWQEEYNKVGFNSCLAEVKRLLQEK